MGVPSSISRSLPSLPVQHWRVQWAVGQGFFHSGGVSVEPRLPGVWELPRQFPRGFQYIYDCGALDEYATARSREISAYLNRLPESRLDVLFLSHMHADHVNGIDQLLNASGMRVSTIVIPYVGVLERLMLFVRASLQSSRSQFYDEAVVDPIGALASLRPNEIIVIRAEDQGIPPAPDLPPSPDDDPIIVKRFTGGDTLRYDLLGTGLESFYESPAGRVRIIDSRDFRSLRVVGVSAAFWELIPHVQPNLIDKESLLSLIALKLGNTVEQLKSDLTSTEYRRHLISRKFDALREAYEKLCKRINPTTLSLYSGPMDAMVLRKGQTTVGCHFRCCWVGENCAWLGTGDAELKKGKYLSEFQRRYRAYVKNVFTMTAPHHGSDASSCETLFSFVDPCICVVPADKHRTWLHPGRDVVHNVASVQASLVLVTANELNRFYEEFELDVR